MRRRAFLGRFTSALACVPAMARAGRPQRVAVIGAGILGASIAYRLARRGAEVELLDREGPAAGATRRSFAWLNAHHSKQPRHYHELNRQGIAAWHALEHELPLDIRWSGSVEWYPESSEARELGRLLPLVQSWGHAVRSIDAEEIRRLESSVVPGDAAAAALAEGDGFLDPVRVTLALVGAARAAGASVRSPCAVRGFDLRGGRVQAVLSGDDAIRADAVVIAAGVDSERLASMLGVRLPLVPAPGLLVHSAPHPALVSRVFTAAKAHVKQYADGRLVIGDDFGPPQTAVHRALAEHPADFPSEGIRALHEARLLSQAQEYLPGLAGVRAERLTLGWRPLPADGHPIVGASRQCPNAYMAVTHSGVTLAALLGALAATELLDGVAVDLLEAYRPSRFSP